MCDRFAEYDEVAEDELGKPARLGVDLLKCAGDRFPRTADGGRLCRAAAFGRFGNGDLCGDGKIAVFGTVDARRQNDRRLLNVDETEVGAEKEQEQKSDDEENDFFAR